MNIGRIFKNGMENAYNDVLNEINTILIEGKYVNEYGEEDTLYCEHQDILEALIIYIKKQLKKI